MSGTTIIGGTGGIQSLLSGALFGAGGSSGDVAISASAPIPITIVLGNHASSRIAAYDPSAFSGAGGIQLLQHGVYLLTCLVIPVIAGSTGSIDVDVTAIPFNGFSDISGATFQASDPPPPNPFPIPMLYFTGPDSPLDIVGLRIINNTNGIASAILSSVQVMYIGDV